MASLESVTKAMTLFTRTCKNAELKPEMPKLWASLLQDIPDDLLMAAAQQLSVELTFFPALAELRNKAIELKYAGMNIPIAGEAWEEVIKKIHIFGHGSTPEFSHPLIRKAVECMVWNHLCMSEQIEYDRSQFFKVYDQLKDREVENLKMLPDVKAVSAKYALAADQLIKRLSANN